VKTSWLHGGVASRYRSGEVIVAKMVMVSARLPNGAKRAADSALHLAAEKGMSRTWSQVLAAGLQVLMKDLEREGLAEEARRRAGSDAYDLDIVVAPDWSPSR
jgi:hypothetical protein